MSTHDTDTDADASPPTAGAEARYCTHCGAALPPADVTERTNPSGRIRYAVICSAGGHGSDLTAGVPS